MYPFINISDLFYVYLFGLTITICFFMLIWMLKKLSVRYSFDFLIFEKNLLWYFISAFLFSRLFYILSMWNDLKNMKNPLQFFIMSDYKFSLMGAIFGFFLVFAILLKIRKEKLDHFISGIVLSFLFVLPVGYIGALLGGQVYGKETNYGIEIIYSNPFTPVHYQIPVFPLPIVYSIVFFILFSILYILSINEKHRTILAYLGAMAFSCIIFSLEPFSGKFDIFKELFVQINLSHGINLSQICAIIIFLFCFVRLIRIYIKKEDD